MRVLSINVSLPKSVPYLDGQVFTGIFKKPVQGPIHVRSQNLDGDRQADLKVHGGSNKAVYVYTWENVDYWRKTLGRDDLVAGSFGENLTVEGLPESAVHIGDEFEIGTARFQVSQPRLPCYKLGIAMGMPDFPRIFQQSGKTGFYLRVLREGIIDTGNEVRQFKTTDPDPVSVLEMVRIYSSADRHTKDIERALRLRALSPGWKEDLKEKLSARASNK